MVFKTTDSSANKQENLINIHRLNFSQKPKNVVLEEFCEVPPPKMRIS